MKRALFLGFLFSALAAGCASSSAGGPDHPHEHEGHHEHGEHGEGHHEHKMAGGMKAFHDLLAPPYHMDKGPARNDAACLNVPGMKDATGKIAAEPKGDPAAWKTKADTLAQSVESLDKACGVAGRSEVEAKFEPVHQAFHALMEGGRLARMLGTPGWEAQGILGGWGQSARESPRCGLFWGESGQGEHRAES